MASDNQTRGKKRSKAWYRKSAHGGKKQCTSGVNILEPGIRGFLILCNHDERSAVREAYNILNEYADTLYGPDKNVGLQNGEDAKEKNFDEEKEDDDDDDMEKALKKEVDQLKKTKSSTEKRFQNVATKAKNCVFIRTSLANPTELTIHLMEDIAQNHLQKARYAARILPIQGTCRANTKDIEKLAEQVLTPLFSKESKNVPSSCSVLFKMRNNQGTSCGRESVVPAVTKIIRDINPDVTLSWNDYSVAIIIEVVQTVCCIGVAPDYIRLRKYNLQGLQQGPKCDIKDHQDNSLQSGESAKTGGCQLLGLGGFEAETGLNKCEKSLKDLDSQVKEKEKKDEAKTEIKEKVRNTEVESVIENNDSFKKDENEDKCISSFDIDNKEEMEKIKAG